MSAIPSPSPLAGEGRGEGGLLFDQEHGNMTFRRNDRRISGMLDQKTLDDIIRRIVEVAQPEKIILFGSAARGDMNRHSDVDLLIIKECANPLELMGQIYQNLHRVGAAIDAIVVTPQAVERYKDSHALVIKPALREGRIVYEAS